MTKRVLSSPSTQELQETGFAQRLRTHRVRAGLTRAALGEKIGNASSGIIAMEEGRRDPRMVTLRRLCLVLNCSADDLLFGE